MKKLLRFADCFVLLAAIIGCILRLWLQNTGIDKKGLYQTSHPAWLLLCIISVAIVAFLWFATRAAGEDRRYEVNFPRSKVGGVTYAMLALVLTYVGITELLDATRPAVVAISVGENYYGHPSEELLDRLENYGCLVYRTDLDGNLIFRR